MNRYRFTGTSERIFPDMRPAIIAPGDVITAEANPHPYWFELVPEPETKKPTPRPRDEITVHPTPLAALEAAMAQDDEKE
jgi:hypothetical protein